MTNPSSVPASSVMLGPIGAYSAEMRKERIDRFMEKRKKRVWTKKVWFRTVCSYVFYGCYLLFEIICAISNGIYCFLIMI